GVQGEGDQDQGGQGRATEHHWGRGDLFHRDLDEQIRQAPDDRHRGEKRPGLSGPAVMVVVGADRRGHGHILGGVSGGSRLRVAQWARGRRSRVVADSEHGIARETVREAVTMALYLSLSLLAVLLAVPSNTSEEPVA